MSRWVPCSREKFIRRLRKHDYMVYGHHRRMMIKEIEVLLGHKISADEWNNLLYKENRN